MKYVFPGSDLYLMILIDALALIGFIILQRLNPSMGLKQIEWFGLGSCIFVIMTLLTSRIKKWDYFYYPLIISGGVILLVALVFGKEVGGARNWFSIGRYTIQPSEFVKLIIIFVLAIELKEQRHRKERIPTILFVAVSIMLVVLQKDLGAAFIYFCLFILLYYIATSDWLITILSLGATVIGSIISYNIFSHIKVRIEAWRDPWANIQDKGYQIAQSLIAIGSGGLMGLGLGLGSPQVIPASKTDFIFAAICEEMGILVGLAVIGFYILIMVKGVMISLNASNAFDALLSMGATIALTIQSFIIIGGVIKLVPLTGVTMPFVSYGGSSMLASMGLLGILQGIAVKENRNVSDEEDMAEGVEDEEEVD